ncbi:hypothetical protein ACQ4M3_24205 [Leptolyngbya sp. AN03gr2]
MRSQQPWQYHRQQPSEVCASPKTSGNANLNPDRVKSQLLHLSVISPFC